MAAIKLRARRALVKTKLSSQRRLKKLTVLLPLNKKANWSLKRRRDPKNEIA